MVDELLGNVLRLKIQIYVHDYFLIFLTKNVVQ